MRDADFLNYCGKKCQAEKDLTKKIVRQGIAIKLILRSDELINNKYFWQPLSTFAEHLVNKSAKGDISGAKLDIEELKKRAVTLLFEGAILDPTTKELSFPDESKFGLARKQNLFTYIKDRVDLMDTRIEELKNIQLAKDERVQNKAQTFKNLYSSYSWATLSSGFQNKLKTLTDEKLEDVLLLMEDYLAYETDTTLIKEYEDKVGVLIKEQNERAEFLEEESMDYDTSDDLTDGSDGNDGNDGSDGSEGSGGSNGEEEETSFLQEYKWYIGGALLLGIVGVIVVRKI